MSLSSTLRALGAAAVLLTAGSAAAQSPAVFTVNSPADDSNARDANPGDGVCVDTFTDSNPDAEPRCTLRAAVDEANALGGDVVINLPGQLAGGASGSYTLSRVAPNDADNTYEDDNAFGDLDLDGANLTLRGTGTPGPTVTIGPNDRVFHLISGTVRIERITVNGGTAQPGANGVSSPGPGEMVDGADGADGGCILVDAGVTATFSRLSVNNCATSSGGNGAAPAAADTPGGNAGRGGDGAGIANYGTLTLEKSFVAQNTAGDGGSPGGGTAGGGGAVAGGDGGPGGSGGGLYNEGTLTVRESTIFGNSGGDPSAGAAGTNGGETGAEGEGGAGGGIATVNGGTADISGSIVAANAAGDDTNNDGTTPSATKQPGSDVYDGSIADSDTEPGPNPYTAGTVTDGGYNLIGSNSSVSGVFPDTASGTGTDSNNNIVGSGQGDAATRVDPVISGSNQNQDYDVLAYELGATSPAIDAGDPALMMTVDGRGYVRPDSTDGSVQTADIGAFEFGSEAAPEMLVINEIDFVTVPSSEEDAMEFVEIKNTGIYQAQLADYALVFYSGEDDAAYLSLNLQGALAPGESFTLGDAAMSGMSMFDQAALMGAADDIRDEDGAVGIYAGKASDYPVGAAAGQNEATRRDVVVYDNGMQASLTGGPLAKRDASTLAAAFGQSEDEIASGDTDGASIQRNDNGTYSAGTPSPGGDTAPQDASMNVVINEVDADTPGTDAAEFVELSDGGRGNTPLDGLALVLFNGSNDSVYATFDLDGQTTGSDGFFVLCGDAANVANCDFDVMPNTNLVQNGADAVALYDGDDETGTLLDVVLYGTADSIDDGLRGLFDASGIEDRTALVQYEEDYNGAKDDQSVQRVNDAATTDGYSLLFYAAAPSPGAVNVSEITVDETDTVADAAGWRLLSSPVLGSGQYDGPAGEPLRVDFYAENVNLVQGVPAGTPAAQYQAQFPGAEDILFTDYRADGSYAAAETTGEPLAPGAGFFWYWFDQDFQPAAGAGGDSRGYDLGSMDFAFAATGLPVDDRTASTSTIMPVQVERTVGADGFAMVGNPYAYPYSVDELTVSAGTLSDVFNAFDPASNSYVQITADEMADPGAANTAAVWQGLFAEVTGQAGNSVTFSAPSSGVVPTLESFDGIYRSADASRVALALSGMTAGGTEVNDLAASVRFLETADAGWDRHDGSKLTPLGATFALIAPVGVRDGAPRRQGALSLPLTSDAVTVPLAFRTTDAGQFEITAPETGSARVMLRDTETGAQVSLADGAVYAFSADAGDWAERFELTVTPSSVVGTDDDAARELSVSTVYPNPATGAAHLDVTVPETQSVRVELFDALGRRVAVALDGEIGESSRVRLPAERLAPGVYVVRVTGETFSESRRLTVVR